ncbi:MAG: hypothetical protein K1X78_14495 [Verrucomicrobiaceae bacterium]|nr:hypothetical protein [Verrucomicrobiaceae bacterium]
MRVTLIFLLLTFVSSLHAETAAPAALSPEDSATLCRIAATRERLGRVSREVHAWLRVGDQNKPAGLIAELLNPAEQNGFHLLPPGRFGWSALVRGWQGYVKDTPSVRLSGNPLPGKLAIGGIVEGGLGCHGLVDNVRLSCGSRDICTAPITRLMRDDTPLGVWDFDELR